MLRRLEDYGVAGGDGADDGHQVELEGEVVGADDEDGAQGLVAQARPHGRRVQREVDYGLVARPPVQPVGDGDALGLAPVELREVRLVPALAHVARQRLLDERPAVDEAPVQPPDLALAEPQLLGHIGAERRAHRLMRGLDVVQRRRGVGRHLEVHGYGLLQARGGWREVAGLEKVA